MWGVMCVNVICVLGMIDIVILVNVLHSCIKIPFWKEKREGGKKKKKDVVADMVIVVKQNETKG